MSPSYALLNNPQLTVGIMAEPTSSNDELLGGKPSMEINGDCFLVPGPVRMSQNTLKSMSHPVITARGSEYREIILKNCDGETLDRLKKLFKSLEGRTIKQKLIHTKLLAKNKN